MRGCVGLIGPLVLIGHLYLICSYECYDTIKMSVNYDDIGIRAQNILGINLIFNS
jgi:hypothetical protein